MLRCNVLFKTLLIVLALCVVPLSSFAQDDQAPADRDIQKIQENKNESRTEVPLHDTRSKQDGVVAGKDSIPLLTKDTAVDSAKTVVPSDSLVATEPALEKKEFHFTNLDMKVTAFSFITWLFMMCWAAFSS